MMILMLYNFVDENIDDINEDEYVFNKNKDEAEKTQSEDRNIDLDFSENNFKNSKSQKRG